MNSRTGIRTNLLITTAVIITVMLALFMSRQDGRDGNAFVAVLTGTEAANVPSGVQITPAAILLPTTTGTVPPIATTVVSVNTEGETAGETAVSILPRCQNAPAHWLPHITRDGETIYTLSISSGATAAEIVQANCLAMEQLIAGLTIYLPPQPPTRIACGPPHWWQSQLVQAGDTLYSLAARHATTVYAIMQANCLGSSYLVAGRTLYLPPVVIPPTSIPTLVPTVAVTAVPTSITPTIPTAVPTLIPTPLPTISATATSIPPTLPPLTPTVTLTPLPTATFTPIPTIMATETAVSTLIPPTSTPTIAPTSTLPPPTATIVP